MSGEQIYMLSTQSDAICVTPGTFLSPGNVFGADIRHSYVTLFTSLGWSMRVKQDLVLDLADTENELQFSSVTPASSESDKKVVPSYARSPAVTCCKEYGDA